MLQRSPDKPFASLADIAACRTMLRGGSRSFFAASLVLPRGIRESATGLYAFCRMADDAIDHGTDRPRALAELRNRLARIYAGDPVDIAADRAFADSVGRHGIPKSFPDALLEGFEWDSANRRYGDISELKAYGVRVAGSVGAMMAMVMGVRDPYLLGRACDLGVAMQLTNIARDVGEDARAGRLYLPLDWLRDAGIEAESWVARPVFDERVAGVVQRLLAAAEELYTRADAGITNLPSSCRPGMYAARLLYAEIARRAFWPMPCWRPRGARPRWAQRFLTRRATCSTARAKRAVISRPCLRNPGVNAPAGRGSRIASFGSSICSSGSSGASAPGNRRRTSLRRDCIAHQGERGIRNGSRHCTQRERKRFREIFSWNAETCVPNRFVSSRLRP